jgi:hypothetical protein
MEITMDDGSRISKFEELKNATKKHYGSLFTQQDGMDQEASTIILVNIPSISLMMRIKSL